MNGQEAKKAIYSPCEKAEIKYILNKLNIKSYNNEIKFELLTKFYSAGDLPIVCAEYDKTFKRYKAWFSSKNNQTRDKIYDYIRSVVKNQLIFKYAKESGLNEFIWVSYPVYSSYESKYSGQLEITFKYEEKCPIHSHKIFHNKFIHINKGLFSPTDNKHILPGAIRGCLCGLIFPDTFEIKYW